jgi:hypothetical protein
MSFALGSEARASSSVFPSQATLGTWTAGKAPKPGATPGIGEPDSPSQGPLPPKDGPYATGRSGWADWTLRFQWLLRTLLMQLPKRLP